VTAFPVAPRRPPEPRVTPGGRREIGLVNAAIAVAARAVTRTGSTPRIFTTLGRHRRLFRAWLRFASRLMPRGRLPRRDTELVILRVSVNCGCDYEWGHHVVIGHRAGLSDEEIARVAHGPDADGWDDHERALLRAVDELGRNRVIADATWSQLRVRYDETRLIELCLLAGHYEMLAGTLNSLGVKPDVAPGRFRSPWSSR
jgi:AhpD family alkylhydroperoxidase